MIIMTNDSTVILQNRQWGASYSSEWEIRRAVAETLVGEDHVTLVVCA